MTRPLRTELETGRQVFVEALDAFVDVVSSLDDADLLADSRCQGWRVAEVVAHVHLALQEMTLGFLSPSDDPPDTDTAAYWTSSPPTNDPSADQVDAIRFVQRLASSYTRPRGLVTHLRMTTDVLRRAAGSVPDGAVAFQGHVLATGDFLATWAVELAVHHLDLGHELDLPDPPPSVLTVARATVEALAGEALPAGWSDARAVLIATGRIALDAQSRAQAGEVATRLPVLG